jgi:hypothetical protein
LLETKYLYQKASIDAEAVFARLKEKVLPNWHSEYDALVQAVSAMPFILTTNITIGQPQGSLGQIPLAVRLKNVTMFCQRPSCERGEAFRPIWHIDMAREVRPLWPAQVPRLPIPTDFQVFLLAFQCQHCEGIPEAILVKRSKWQLSLDGRSPMASVEVVPFIPRKESYLFRDAIIAHGAGKTLAGLFYLRTFVEQFGRRITGIAGKETGDHILSEYSKTLPPNVRDSMPSLAEWYDKLSAAIHAASPDEELFKTAQEKIEKHFEIRKAMSIPETPAKEFKSSAAEAADSHGD